MKKVDVADWKPADDLSLENNADLVVKTSDNRLVIAGPGAGKTELLAQKACYLLQTNTCMFPLKILAISFKRDAAFNLKQRVKLRCGDELSRRFESFTYDAFAKQLVDRFLHALPSALGLSENYEIIFDDKRILDYYKAEDINYKNTTQDQVIFNFHHAQLPHTTSTRAEQIRSRVWTSMLKPGNQVLSFRMVMRLAEYIININPKVKTFLQQTYQYVFLDEF